MRLSIVLIAIATILNTLAIRRLMKLHKPQDRIKDGQSCETNG